MESGDLGGLSRRRIGVTVAPRLDSLEFDVSMTDHYMFHNILVQ